MKEKVSAKVVFKCGVVLGQVLIRSLKKSGPWSGFDLSLKRSGPWSGFDSIFKEEWSLVRFDLICREGWSIIKVVFNQGSPSPINSEVEGCPGSLEVCRKGENS